MTANLLDRIVVVPCRHRQRTPSRARHPTPDPCSRRAAWRWSLLALIAGVACGGTGPRDCTPLPLTPAAAEQYGTLGANLPFDPILPCSYRSDVEVVRVLVNIVPAGDPQPRISFIAERRGDRAFTFSVTAAALPFTAIPQGTHRVRTTAVGVVASGFAGPSGGGDQIAYLRWQLLGLPTSSTPPSPPGSPRPISPPSPALSSSAKPAPPPPTLAKPAGEDLRPRSRSRTTLRPQLRRLDHRLETNAPRAARTLP